MWQLPHFCGGVAERHAADVAIAAGCVTVRAGQWKVGVHVLEDLDVETHDVRVAALVLGVARIASGAVDCRTAAMKACVRSDVVANVPVADEAQIALALIAARFMTTFAIVLNVSVRLDHAARHDECLERERESERRHDHTNAQRGEIQSVRRRPHQ